MPSNPKFRGPGNNKRYGKKKSGGTISSSTGGRTQGGFGGGVGNKTNK